MDINIQKFNEVAEAAKAKTNDKRWQNAIDAAVAGVTSGWWVITELHDGVMVTTECGQSYHANGSCQCRAFELGQPCKHRALARLIDLYNAETAYRVPGESGLGEYETLPQIICKPDETEMAQAVSLEQDVAASPRQHLILEIENLWDRTQTTPLAVELMARFKCNKLEFLDDDQLRRVRMAVAM